MPERTFDHADPSLSARQSSPRSLTVAGVRYTRRRERPAFFARSPAWIYDVRFPDGEQMRIRPTPTRRFQDLTHDALPDGFERLAETIRPGSRVLIVGAGTGLAGHIIVHIVGLSGGAVTIENDGESVRYARKRYPSPIASIEVASPTSLDGEADGTFDAAISMVAMTAASGLPESVPREELLRVLRDKGRLFVPLQDLPDAPPDCRIGGFAWLVRQAPRPDPLPPATDLPA